MATLKFLLQSKSDNAPIYVRLSIGRGKIYYRKTGLTINPKDWSTKFDLPINNSGPNKNTSSKLKKLDAFIFEELNDDTSEGVDITSDWLQNKIDTFFNRVETLELDYLTEYGEHFIKNLKYKVNDRTKGVGVSVSTQKKYRTIVNKLIAYDNYKRSKNKSSKRIKLVDVNLNFRNQLIEYFDKEHKLSDNTIGRYLKFVKSICLDAKKNSYKVSPQLNDFLGFTVTAPKIILTLEEIEIIKNKSFVSDSHSIARDWLIIGCYTGQRVSDLLRMNKTFIEHIQDHDFIVLKQIKSGKTVQIPIHYEVKEILNKRNGDFPPTFAKSIDSSKAMFNRYLKELCKLSGIDKVVNGNKFDEVEGRKVNGYFPKHELVSSHICRRSFASNFYATELYPTPILMNITAHSTEKMFLEYIGKEPIDYSLQLAKIWQKEGVKQKQVNENISKLKVVKKASNQN